MVIRANANISGSQNKCNRDWKPTKSCSLKYLYKYITQKHKPIISRKISLKPEFQYEFGSLLEGKIYIYISMQGI